MIQKSYNGNPYVKADGVQHAFTQHEVHEYIKCMNDVAYFCKNYVKVISLDKGLVNFELRGYQEKMVKHFNDNRFNIILACRQSGKSITSVAWLLHYIIFNGNKKIGVLANKGSTAREMLARLTLMLENLPFFLQPGVKILNKGNIVFSNNSEIIAAATSGSSIRGLSLNCVTGDTSVDLFDGNNYCSKHISELHDNQTEYVVNKTWSVKSEDGVYRKFDGIKKSQVNGYYILSFNNGLILKITGDHLIKTKEGYRKARLLRTTDHVYTADSKYATLTNSLFINEKIDVYDLVNVSPTRNFFANGLLIHNCIFLDEFAFVHKAEEFYTSTYPVISSGKDTKVIITSTPNGVGNMFYKIWEGSIQKANEYKPFTIKWQDVPGRDEAWRVQTIANTSELQFNQEYNCLDGDSIITVRDNTSGSIFNITLNELYNRL